MRVSDPWLGRVVTNMWLSLTFWYRE